MPDLKKKIKEKKTGEVYSSKKVMVKHEKSESKAFEKKEDKKGKSSPLKIMGTALSAVASKVRGSNSNNTDPFGTKLFGMNSVGGFKGVNVNSPSGVTKSAGMTGSAMNSLQDVFYPKNATAPGNKSPFKKISKEALAKHPVRPLEKKVSTMTRKRNQTK